MLRSLHTDICNFLRGRHYRLRGDKEKIYQIVDFSSPEGSSEGGYFDVDIYSPSGENLGKRRIGLDRLHSLKHIPEEELPWAKEKSRKQTLGQSEVSTMVRQISKPEDSEVVEEGTISYLEFSRGAQLRKLREQQQNNEQ